MKYKEIASFIRNKIIMGDWFYGMKIPSHRKLAEQFKVNRVTVIKSIEVLEAEGFIYTKPGSGTYVNNYLSESFVMNKWEEMMEWSVASRSQYTVQLINRLETDEHYIHLSKGELGKDLIPHIELKNAMNAVANYIGDLAFGYNDGYGYKKLRELIAERLNNEGMNINTGNVMITSGALHALQLLVTGFLSQNTVVFSNTPSYINSTYVFNSLNLKNIQFDYNDMHAFKACIDKYHHYKDKAIYVETPFNNPTGASLSHDEKEQILKSSKMYNIPIIEDDIYKDIWFSKKAPVSLKALDNKGLVIHISSFSKSIAPALRIGWIIASEKVIEQLADVRMQIDYGSSILSQMVIYEMLNKGDYDRHIIRLKEILIGKRDFMLSLLKKWFLDVAEWKIPEGSFFIWLEFKINIDIKKLFSYLIDHHQILINPGYIYGETDNSIRLSYSYETNDNIEFALMKIKEYIDDELKDIIK